MNIYTFQLKTDCDVELTIKAKNYVEALAAIHRLTDSNKYKHIDTIFCNE
jgi:hypothetical protein